MIFCIADVEIDDCTREVRRGQALLEAEPKVLDLLLYLASHRDRVVQKDELFDSVWEGRVVGESALARVVCSARKLLGSSSSIKTHYGRGYRLVAPVHQGRTAGVQEGRLETVRTPALEGFDPFVGRSGELALAERWLEATVSGESRTLAISGEAGIGKSAMCERFATIARSRGVLTLFGRCSEVPGAPAYWPWIQLLRETLRALPRADTELCAAHPEVQALLSSVGPNSGAASPADGGHARFRLFDGISRFFHAASELAPLAVFIDDLHRADTPSLLLLEFIVEHVTASRVLTVVAYRDAEMRAESVRTRLLGKLSQHRGARVLGLAGLERAQIGEFVRKATGREPSPAALDHLVLQTGGNPFYLSQLVPTLGGCDANDVPPTVALPRGVRDAIEGHLNMLPPAARRALECASVVGREFATGLLASALGVARSALLESLQIAIDASLLVARDDSDEVLRFAHVLIRDALYVGLSASDRAALHRTVGEVFERAAHCQAESVASELSHHFVRGETAEKAIRYSVLAGDIALEKLAYEDAARYFDVAVSLLGEDSADSRRRRCELLLKLGTSQTRSGDRDAARTSFRRAANLAREIHAPGRLAQVALDLAPGFFSIETGILDDYLVERLEEALDALGDGEPMLRLLLLGRLAVALYWTPDTRRRAQLCAEAESLARVSGGDEARLHTAIARHAALWCPENLDERLRTSQELTELSEALGNRDAMLVGRCFRVTDLLESGDIDAVRDEVGRFSRLAHSVHQPECVWMAEMYDTMLAMLRGEFERVEVFARHSIELGRRLGHHNALETGGAYIALSRCEVGRVDEFLPTLEQYAESYPAVPGWYSFVAIACMRAGNLERARRALRAAMAKTMPLDTIWLASAVWLAETAAALDAPEEASVLYERLAPLSGRHAVLGYGIASFGAVDRYLGLLCLAGKDWELAVSHLDTALAQNRRLDSDPIVAHTERELATALWRRAHPGDRDRAGGLLANATCTADRLGMTWLRAQTEKGLDG